jgi:2-phospho-L-lactate/phosphoenolpyruvate guanylyltransferase
MRYILIPVKDLTRAKQRLAAVMTQAERTQFAWVMLENTFAAAAQTRTADRVAVVTLYPPAIALAKKYGMEVICESEQISESASVDFGSQEVGQRGAAAVLRLPIDLPLLTTADIGTVLNCDSVRPSTVIVPSRDGTGTNAILRRPPRLFPSHFGPGSLAKHVAEAKTAGVPCEIINLPRIALDVDEPEDLLVLLHEGQGSPVHQWLIKQGISERVVQHLAQAL